MVQSVSAPSRSSLITGLHTGHTPIRGNQGVDEFYGYNCQRLAHHYFHYHLWHNTEKVMLKGNEGTAETEYSPYLIHSQATPPKQSQAKCCTFWARQHIQDQSSPFTGGLTRTRNLPTTTPPCSPRFALISEPRVQSFCLPSYISTI